LPYGTLFKRFRKPSARLIEDLGMDSLDIVEFIMKIEKDFDLIIDDNDPILDDIKTVSDVVNGLKNIILKNEYTNNFNRSSDKGLC